MDFKNLLENIKEKCRLIFEKVRDYALENTMISACVAALFLVIIIAIILLLIIIFNSGFKSCPRL